MSEKNEQKKVKERGYLEAFRQLYRGFPAGAIEASESPDFLLKSDTHCIGIEVTEVFRDGAGANGSERKALEGEKKRVVRNARSAYEKRILPPVVVDVGWRPTDNLKLPRSRRATLELELARCVENALPAPNSRAELEQTGLPGSPLPDEISYLTVDRRDFMTEGYWNYSRSDFIAELAPEHIRRVLEEKEKRTGRYLERCDELWLLIVADGRHPSSFFEPSQGAEQSTFETRFHRLLVLFFVERKAVEFSTRRRFESEGVPAGP